MTSTEILDRLHDLGVTVQANGLKVRLEPASKVPAELLAQVKEHKPEIIRELRQPYGDGQPPSQDRQPTKEPESLERLITRLKNGHTWLLDQHQKWQAGDSDAESDEEFSRVWNRWWELDQRLRADHGFQGCVYDPDGTCPEGFPCLGCSDLPAPAVVAQLALEASIGTR